MEMTSEKTRGLIEHLRTDLVSQSLTLKEWELAYLGHCMWYVTVLLQREWLCRIACIVVCCIVWFQRFSPSPPALCCVHRHWAYTPSILQWISCYCWSVMVGFVTRAMTEGEVGRLHGYGTQKAKKNNSQIQTKIFSGTNLAPHVVVSFFFWLWVIVFSSHVAGRIGELILHHPTKAWPLLQQVYIRMVQQTFCLTHSMQGIFPFPSRWSTQQSPHSNGYLLWSLLPNSYFCSDYSQCHLYLGKTTGKLYGQFLQMYYSVHRYIVEHSSDLPSQSEEPRFYQITGVVHSMSIPEKYS